MRNLSITTDRFPVQITARDGLWELKDVAVIDLGSVPKYEPSVLDLQEAPGITYIKTSDMLAMLRVEVDHFVTLLQRVVTNIWDDPYGPPWGVLAGTYPYYDMCVHPFSESYPYHKGLGNPIPIDIESGKEPYVTALARHSMFVPKNSIFGIDVLNGEADFFGIAQSFGMWWTSVLNHEDVGHWPLDLRDSLHDDPDYQRITLTQGEGWP